MSEKILSAPPECDKVQPVVQPPEPLVKEYMDSVILRDFTKFSSLKTKADGSENYIGNLKSLDILGPDDKYLSARFHDGGIIDTISDRKKIQLDDYDYDPRARGGKWTVDISTGLITNTGELNPGARRSVSWREPGSNGTLTATAFYDSKTKAVSNLVGQFDDLHGNKIAEFRYSFGPDGKATLCARNTPVREKPDQRFRFVTGRELTTDDFPGFGKGPQLATQIEWSTVFRKHEQ